MQHGSFLKHDPDSNNHEHTNTNGVGNGVSNGSSHEKPYNIYMDSMGFGMGACCLQCTFQCCNINEARHFYDQLSILSGPLLALTAGTPIFRGLLADIDVRWTVISQSVDDRTPAERGAAGGKAPIPKSRYDSISTFISPDPSLLPQYNDLEIPIDNESYETLVSAGVDKVLARHIAHLFTRDPLVIYGDKIQIDDSQNSDHFENIQSTNWQTVRFKPPPPNSTIGWRVEFRPMEVQLTDFENAAFVAFIVLVTRVISSFALNMYTPISLVDENMKTAHKRDAVNREKFYFRKNILNAAPTDEAQVEMMTINEIINGSANFIGLIPLINVYLDSSNIDPASRDVITQYLSLISKRASGELLTAASWIRKFVQTHPDYKHDSVVSDQITYDLVTACNQISHGTLHVSELLGDFKIL
jgi:glutamate--cysteine ligase catalytic subunit